jgi:TatD DNase family protein
MQPLQFIDSHCHLDLPLFDSDRESVLNRCRELGVSHIVVPGVTALQWDNLLNICREHDSLYPAIGIHPLFIESDTVTEDLKVMNFLLNNSLTHNYSIVAIGEVGLDGTEKSSHKISLQQKIFIAQLKIAEEHNLPLILHIRKAHQTAIEILKHNSNHGGVVHAFSGSLEQALEYIKLGFKIGVGGTISRVNAKKLRRTICNIPLESITLETDSPDLAPLWAKDERNSPHHIPKIAEVVAEIRGDNLERVATQTTENAKTIFNIKL